MSGCWRDYRRDFEREKGRGKGRGKRPEKRRVEVFLIANFSKGFLFSSSVFFCLLTAFFWPICGLLFAVKTLRLLFSMTVQAGSKRHFFTSSPLVFSRLESSVDANISINSNFEGIFEKKCFEIISKTTVYLNIERPKNTTNGGFWEILGNIQNTRPMAS